MEARGVAALFSPLFIHYLRTQEAACAANILRHGGFIISMKMRHKGFFFIISRKRHETNGTLCLAQKKRPVTDYRNAISLLFSTFILTALNTYMTVVYHGAENSINNDLKMRPFKPFSA